MAGKVTTWADGFGTWHASVPITGDERADERTARKAIRAELVLRYGTLPTYRLRVTREHVTNHGTAHYREV